MKQKNIFFDVMLRGRFVCTLRFPITLDVVVGYDRDKPLIDFEAFRRLVEQKRPTLKGQPYEILF